METIVVLDFGGQYTHLIGRRIRELGVYSEILPAETKKEELEKIPKLKGIILSGGAKSVYENDSPVCSKDIFSLNIPVLGICYGHQIIAHVYNGEVRNAPNGEYGLTELEVHEKCKLLNELNKKEDVWMNHKDVVFGLPKGFYATARTAHSPVAAFKNERRKIYGVQFHPEVTHTTNGKKILENFALKICQCSKSWNSKKIIEAILKETSKETGKKKALVALSGGIDSSVATVLVSKVLNKNLTAVYVDTGLMRYKETGFMKKTFSRFDLNLKIVDAKRRFFNALKEVTDPERKRKIIGKLFIDIFEEVAKKEKAEVLIQGTIYSDRIESGGTKHAANIKSHHNVGGLPKNMKLTIYEPLRNLYKDEVRAIAKEIDLPSELITRHVFPGPGIAIRIIGEVTLKKAEIVRKSGYILEEELRKADLYRQVWMGFTVLLPIKSVGIQGDARSYKYSVVLRIIESKDAMTANFAKIPYDILEKISTRITNEIKEINRVVYDISNKPPATMEWE